MKNTYILFFCLILSFTFSFGQNAAQTYSEFKGMEDYLGKSNLFYRINYTTGGQMTGQYDYHTICRLNVPDNTESYFRDDYAYSDIYQTDDHYEMTNDFDFWHSNPSEYIVCGTRRYLTSHYLRYIFRFDNVWGIGDFPDPTGGYFSFVRISHQNDSLVYAVYQLGSSRNLHKSTDGGRNWAKINSNFSAFSLSPFNDKILFGINSNSNLYKTTDGGITQALVDSNPNTYLAGNLIRYDKDSNYIYRSIEYIVQNQKVDKLLVSGNAGNPDSWQVKYTTNNLIYISVDTSVAGSLYISVGSDTYHSNDFGNSFSLYHSFDNPLVGIYKKPGSPKLYAATNKIIYEITDSSTVTVLKQLNIVGIEENGLNNPEKFLLSQNYPNPFNPSCIINYQLDKPGITSLIIYDILGNQVAVLINQFQKEGNHSVSFNSDNLSSGIYFYTLRSGNNTMSRKMIVLK